MMSVDCTVDEAFWILWWIKWMNEEEEEAAAAATAARACWSDLPFEICANRWKITHFLLFLYEIDAHIHSRGASSSRPLANRGQHIVFVTLYNAIDIEKTQWGTHDKYCLYSTPRGWPPCCWYTPTYSPQRQFTKSTASMLSLHGSVFHVICHFSSSTSVCSIRFYIWILTMVIASTFKWHFRAYFLCVRTVNHSFNL